MEQEICGFGGSSGIVYPEMAQVSQVTESMSEADLLAASRNGDQQAFEELFRRNQRRVFSVALNFFGGNRQTAEDVTQQVFLKFFRNLKRFRGDARVSTWLYRITVNHCIDEQKKRRRFSFLADLFRDEEGRETDLVSSANEGANFEIRDEVRTAVARLKPIFRLPILLKHVEGLSYSEIAEVLEISEGTVASRLSRGHSKLAERLEHLKER